MLEGGRFNTDSAALARRIEAHEKFGSKALEPWVLANLGLKEGLTVLELGCGTGKQTIPTAIAVGKAGHVLAVDISQAALDAVNERTRVLGLGRRVEVLCCGLDDLDGCLRERAVFDVVFCCFALYYAREPEKVLQIVHRALRPGGVVFFCGPASDNNLELKRFHSAVKLVQIPVAIEVSVFMEKAGPELASRIFGNVEISRFENDLRFDTPESLYSYWRSYNLYEPTMDIAFKLAAEKYFREYSFFLTTKRVIGVRSVR